MWFLWTVIVFPSAKTAFLTGSGDTDVIVPGKTLAELNKILSQEDDDTLSIYLTEKHILFRFRDGCSWFPPD